MDNSSNFDELNESFIQTYLIISGLLLTHIQSTGSPLLNQPTELLSKANQTLSTVNQTDYTQTVLKELIIIGNSGFILFLIFILIYKMTQKLDLSDSYKCLLAFIASICLSLQIVASLNLQTFINSGISGYISSFSIIVVLFLVLTLLIVCTLVPTKYYKQMIIGHVIFTGIVVFVFYQQLSLIYGLYFFAFILLSYIYNRSHPS